MYLYEYYFYKCLGRHPQFSRPDEICLFSLWTDVQVLLQNKAIWSKKKMKLIKYDSKNRLACIYWCYFHKCLWVKFSVFQTFWKRFFFKNKAIWSKNWRWQNTIKIFSLHLYKYSLQVFGGGIHSLPDRMKYTHFLFWPMFEICLKTKLLFVKRRARCSISHIEEKKRASILLTIPGSGKENMLHKRLKDNYFVMNSFSVVLIGERTEYRFFYGQVFYLIAALNQSQRSNRSNTYCFNSVSVWN